MKWILRCWYRYSPQPKVHLIKLCPLIIYPLNHVNETFSLKKTFKSILRGWDVKIFCIHHGIYMKGKNPDEFLRLWHGCWEGTIFDFFGNSIFLPLPHTQKPFLSRLFLEIFFSSTTTGKIYGKKWLLGNFGIFCSFWIRSEAVYALFRTSLIFKDLMKILLGLNLHH